jgi:hypothetical protein
MSCGFKDRVYELKSFWVHIASTGNALVYLSFVLIDSFLRKKGASFGARVYEIFDKDIHHSVLGALKL